MSTLAEIQRAIEKLPANELEDLTCWLNGKSSHSIGWPVPPPNVPREELERIEAEIETAFPSKRD